MPLKQTPFLYKEHKKYRIGPHNKLFPIILTMKRMFCCDERWKNLYAELEATFDEFEDVINLSFIGFPKEWKESYYLNLTGKETE